MTPQARTAWDAKVIAEYAFEQAFDASSGATPLLEAKLLETLAKFKL